MAAQTLLSTGTTYVSSLLSTYNLSTSAVIIVGTDPIYLNSISFLKFDLSSIPVDSVNSAVLRLFVFDKKGVLPSPIVINRVTTDFDINTVTYDTMPAYAPTGITTEITAEEVLTYIEIDITILVNQWLNGDFPNYGIALTNPDGSTSIQFGGKPVGAAFEPQLVINYSQETTNNLGGIQAQLQGSPSAIISDGENVIFDTVIIDESENINYNTETGEFIISAPGNYYVNWWVTTDGSAGPANMVFSVSVNGTSVALGNSPVVTGQLNGDALIKVTDTPVTVTLVNETGADVLYANIPVQANLSILTVT